MEGRQASMAEARLETVPFNDLGRATSVFRDEIDRAVARVISSGWYVLGPEHDAWERELAEYMGVAEAVAVGNGTDALQLALAALGVEPGDTILTAANAGGYSSTAIRALGAIPVFADVEQETLLLSVRTLDAAIAGLRRQPRVIIVTHLFGAAAEIQDIVGWAQGKGILVVEDCAQSLGAIVGGVRAGSVADVATTSFYPTKNLGALGDGGAVLTRDAGIAERVRKLRQYGWDRKYHAVLGGGMNSRLDEMQAAVLRVKLPQLDAWNDRRREIHRVYEGAVGDGARMVNRAGESYVAHLAVIEAADRAHAQEVFARHGVRVDIHYPIPDHRQAIADEGESWSLPVTEAAANHILSIPLFPELTSAEVDRVATALGEV